MSQADTMVTPSTRAWVLGAVVVAFFPLLGLKRTFSIIGIGLALYGLYLLVKRGRDLFANPAVTAALLVAAGFAVPLLLSLPDAAFPLVSLASTGTNLLYLPIMIAVIVLVQEQHISKPVLLFSIAIAVFWAFDAVIQLILGHDIFGVSYSSGRIGTYWMAPAKFGFYLAFFGLFAIAAMATCYPRRQRLLLGLWFIVAIGVLIGGSRAAWLMFFPFSGILLWTHVVSSSRYRWLWLIIGVAMTALLAVAAYELSDTVRSRLDQSLKGLQWSYEAVDAASSRRLELWRIAVEMIQAHPLNGQGLDGYQALFASLAQQPIWANRHMVEGPHPHQLLLEVGTAAGAIGLLGLFFIAVVVRRAWAQASAAQRAMAWPALIYLMAMWFPINTHRSFYSSELIMGNLIMIGLVLGNLLPSHVKNKAVSTNERPSK